MPLPLASRASERARARGRKKKHETETATICQPDSTLMGQSAPANRVWHGLGSIFPHLIPPIPFGVEYFGVHNLSGLHQNPSQLSTPSTSCTTLGNPQPPASMPFPPFTFRALLLRLQWLSRNQNPGN